MTTEERATMQAALDALIELNNWLVCGAIASADDMAQSFPAMQELTEKTIISLKAVHQKKPIAHTNNYVLPSHLVDSETPINKGHEPLFVTGQMQQAYAAGRESMREEAAKVYAEYGALPNLLKAVRSIK